MDIERYRLLAEGTGKKAQNARRALRDHAKREALRAAGYSCENCGAYEYGKCGVLSDFDGVVKTKPDDICLRHVH